MLRFQKKHLCTTLLLALLVCTSCIKDEALNAEADILTCTVSKEIMKREPVIENDKIMVMVNADADLKHQAPEFTLTPGATIEPASGTERDFTTPQHYTVTSEDGNWKKVYTVAFIIAGISTDFSFENVRKYEKKNYTYDIFFDEDLATGNVIDWATGNPGYALTGMGTPDPTSFPTSSHLDGVRGKCVKLETKSTGQFGADLGMPIAAGNLFMGNFDVMSALKSPLNATRFGLPFEHVPTYIRGYYKYKPGEVYTEKGQPVPGKQDTWDIYGIFYEVTPGVSYIDGSVMEDKYTHPNLVSVALLEEKDRKDADEWTEFYIPFVMKPGKAIDREKLKNGGYNVALVFTSSLYGSYFNGAPGSTLYLDEVELIYMNDNDIK